MNEELTTKQKIRDQALNLFSTKGFESVSVAEIASAVGIKAPSLYKHYASKQRILEAIVEEMNNRYHQYVSSMRMDGSHASKDVPLFLNIDEERLIEMGKGIFLFFLHDEYTKQFRKLLTIEQFHNPELGEMLKQQYMIEPLLYQEVIFGQLVHTQFFKSLDSQITALHFYAPLRLLIELCDVEPTKEAEALVMLERHIRQFNQLYRLESEC